MMRIAIDAMGGDYAPTEIIAGGLDWARQSGEEVIFVGQEEIIKKELQAFDYKQEKISIVHASQVVEMDEAPAVALRRKRDSSIVIATKLVKEGQAEAVVSCGSTGAQMAAAIFILGRLEGIERPPVITSLPSITDQPTLLIDVGANVDCKPEQLLQFGQLGSVYARVIKGIENPRVGLLNNGEEESKGNKLALKSYQLLKEQSGIDFIGNVEGRDLFGDSCDVVVCDGFTGNVVIKSLEGVSEYLSRACYEELGKLPSIFASLDYSNVGGAPLMGVTGISVVCHGSSKREAVLNGICEAQNCVKNDLVIQQKLALGETM